MSGALEIYEIDRGGRGREKKKRKRESEEGGALFPVYQLMQGIVTSSQSNAISPHTDGDRQTYRHTDRQTNIHTYRQTDISLDSGSL